MPLDQEQLRMLVSFVASTRDDEIACDECLAGMAEFAETRLVGREINEAQRQVEAHIALCPECAEEYQVLLEAMATAS